MQKSDRVHGSWKVAFADFAIAMMAFFLLLWILNHATQTEKQAISGYFQNPAEYMDSSKQIKGNIVVSEVIDSEQQDDIIKNFTSDEIEKIKKLKQTLEKTIEQTEVLKAYRDQIYLDITKEGLRIQIFDSDQKAMFPRSSARMNNQAFVLLANLAPTINQVANRISIAGHTDAMPFQKNEDYTNWELSVDRANAARNALISGGLQEDKIARVVGLASTVLFDPANPGGASNRRISIVVLNKGVDQSVRMQEEKLNAIIQKTMKDKLEQIQ